MQKEKLSEANKIRNSINVVEKASAGVNSERPWRQGMIIRNQKDDNYTDSELINRNRKGSDYDNNSISGSAKNSLGRSPRKNHALLNQKNLQSNIKGTKSEGENKQIDYLMELRQRRLQQEQNGENVQNSQRGKKVTQIQKYLNDPKLSEYERLEAVKRQAE